jgi:hypothetical protein
MLAWFFCMQQETVLHIKMLMCSLEQTVWPLAAPAWPKEVKHAINNLHSGHNPLALVTIQLNTVVLADPNIQGMPAHAWGACPLPCSAGMAAAERLLLLLLLRLPRGQPVLQLQRALPP